MCARYKGWRGKASKLSQEWDGGVATKGAWLFQRAWLRLQNSANKILRGAWPRRVGGAGRQWEPPGTRRRREDARAGPAATACPAAIIAAPPGGGGLPNRGRLLLPHLPPKTPPAYPHPQAPIRGSGGRLWPCAWAISPRSGKGGSPTPRLIVGDLRDLG